jgi:DNA-binding winged helix-turn-helix (wHTH) protein
MKTYEELEEELAYFKQALKVEQSENRLAKLSKAFGFTPSQAKLALALYDRAGKVLTKEFALEVLYPNPDEAAKRKIVDVIVCKIRTKLIYYCGNQKPIDTVWGRGFQMSPAGIAVFAKALGEAPHSTAQQPPPDSMPAVQEQDDAYELKEALRALVTLKAQADIGCVPPPTKEQWAKAWGVAEELVRVEP